MLFLVLLCSSSFSQSAGFGLLAGIMEGAEGPLDGDEIVCDVIAQVREKEARERWKRFFDLFC